MVYEGGGLGEPVEDGLGDPEEGGLEEADGGLEADVGVDEELVD
jgi:hypothetical protein